MSKDIHILIADDDSDTLEMLRVFFEFNGWQCDAARSPSEAVSLINAKLAASAEHYDAVLMDINFFGDANTPRETGIGLVSDMKESGCHIPVVFISAYVNPIIAEQIKELGARYLTKPLDLDELFVMVVEAINANRSRPDFAIEEDLPVTRSNALLAAIFEARAHMNAKEIYG
jgi:DNA-binding response OmpR family regulator